MKTDNPWVIVRWALVAVVYAATLAIAIDQVRDRNKQIAKLEAWKTNARKLLTDASSGIDRQMADTQAVVAGLETVKTGLIDQQANLAKAAKLQELLALTAQRQQKVEESRILAARFETNIMAGDECAAESNALMARGNVTRQELDQIKRAAQKLDGEHRELKPKLDIFVKEISAIDSRLKVLQEECDLIPGPR